MAVPEITVQGSSVIGAQRQIWGTMTNDSTGGAFSTGLRLVMEEVNYGSISNARLETC